MMESGILICFIALLTVASSADPCMHPKIIDDFSRTTDYSLQPLESARCDLIEPIWYRYLNSVGGVMVTSCPSGSQCGTRNQVWMNDTVPGIGCEQWVNVCIRQENNCCERKSTVRAKNCGPFIVYQLIPPPACSRYCFANTTQTSGEGHNTRPDCLLTSSTLVPKDTIETSTSKPTAKLTKTTTTSSTTSLTKSSTASSTTSSTTSSNTSLIMSSTTSKSTTRESSSTILMSSATTKSNPRTRSSGMRSNQTTNLDVIHFSSTPSPNPLAVKFSATTVGSIQPISSTVKGIFTGVTSWPTYLSSRKDSTSQRMHVTIQSTSSAARKDSSTSKSDFTKKHSSLAKGSVDAAVIVGSSIGGVIAVALIATGAIAAIVRLHRRRKNERKRQAERTHETFAMDRNAVENRYYSIDHTWD